MRYSTEYKSSFVQHIIHSIVVFFFISRHNRQKQRQHTFTHAYTRAPTHIRTHVCRWKRWMIFNDYTEIYFFIITKRCLAHITMMNKIEREADRWRLSGSETEWEKWNHLGLNKWWWRDAKKQRRWIHQVNSRNIARSHTDSDTCDSCQAEWEKNTRRNENKMYKNTQR